MEDIRVWELFLGCKSRSLLDLRHYHLLFVRAFLAFVGVGIGLVSMFLDITIPFDIHDVPHIMLIMYFNTNRIFVSS